jgi:hypothetical protein
MSLRNKKLPLQALSFLLPTLLAAGCQVQASPRLPYDFDLTVRPVGNVSRIVGQLTIELEVTTDGGGYLLSPQLSLDIATSACSSTRFNTIVPLPRHGDTWGANFEASCDSLKRTTHLSDSPASWRLRFLGPHRPANLDRAQLAIHAAPVGQPTEFRSLKGRFTPASLDINIPGFKLVKAEWQLDDQHPKATQYLLALELAPSDPIRGAGSGHILPTAPPGRALAPPAAGEPTVPASGDAGIETAAPDRTTTSGEALRVIEFRAAAQDPQLGRKWPALQAFLRAEGEEAWSRPFELKVQDLAKPQLLELPPAFAGRDLWVQVQAGGNTLPLSDDGATYRARVAGKGAAVATLPVRLAPKVVHLVRVLARDDQNRELAGVTVSVRLWSGSEGAAHLGEERTTETRGKGPIELAFYLKAAKIDVLCAKAGYRPWFWSGALSEATVGTECRLEPESPAPKVAAGPPLPLYFGGQVVGPKGTDAASRGVEAALTLTWTSGKNALVRTDKNGYWELIAPDPPSPLGRLKVEATCFKTYDRQMRTEDPANTQIQLEQTCRNALLEVHLRPAAAFSISKKEWDSAAVEVTQDGRPAGTFGDFDAGSRPVDVLVDPAGGSLEFKARGNLFVGEARIANPLADKQSDYFTPVEIPLRRTGRGVALLVNGAENWPLYPRVLQAVGGAVAAAGKTGASPERLVVGTIEGERKVVDGADLGRSERLGETLAWLRGISPTAVRLRGAQLEKRLLALADLWPGASSWELVLLVPFDSENEDPEGVQAAAKAAADLAALGVVVNVVEAGGATPTMKALAKDESRYLRVGTEAGSLEPLEAFLVNILSASKKQGER